MCSSLLVGLYYEYAVVCGHRCALHCAAVNLVGLFFNAAPVCEMVHV